MADPDVGMVQLATVNNPRGPPYEEEKALYIAVVREQVLRTLKYGHWPSKTQKHALAKKEKKEVSAVTGQPEEGEKVIDGRIISCSGTVRVFWR